MLQGIVLGHDGGEEGVLQGHHLGQLLRGQPRHNAGEIAADGLLPRKAGLLPFRGDAHERFAAVIGVGLTQDMAVLLEQAQPARDGGHRLAHCAGQLRHIDAAVLPGLLDLEMQMLQHTKAAARLAGQRCAHPALAQSVDTAEELDQPAKVGVFDVRHFTPPVNSYHMLIIGMG